MHLPVFVNFPIIGFFKTATEETIEENKKECVSRGKKNSNPKIFQKVLFKEKCYHQQPVICSFAGPNPRAHAINLVNQDQHWKKEEYNRIENVRLQNKK